MKLTIGEHESALGVRVPDLNRQSLVRLDDRVWLVSILPNGVLGERKGKHYDSLQYHK